MVKFDLDFKINVLHQYFDGVGSTTLANRYGISRPTTILLCVHRFGQFGLDGLKARIFHPKYSSEFKISVLNWMKQQGAPYPETALHFDTSAPTLDLQKYVAVYVHSFKMEYVMYKLMFFGTLY
ncbi:helix-turn-helix domain-containing protein [Lacticaseibacillus sharpeae]|uniref:helix-turn-helix domain-containing protein n=1 Tax=Lacticaseibacillus sharpeae TaxID=1626 RepID=UPI0006D017F1|nr:helix-turn-helix domain-containing protein [Lacticaseibacillus sharpeae]